MRYSARSLSSSLNFYYAQKCTPFFADLSIVLFLPCLEQFKVHIKMQGFCNLCWCKPRKNSQALSFLINKTENYDLSFHGSCFQRPFIWNNGHFLFLHPQLLSTSFLCLLFLLFQIWLHSAQMSPSLGVPFPQINQEWKSNLKELCDLKKKRKRKECMGVAFQGLKWCHLNSVSLASFSLVSLL